MPSRLPTPGGDQGSWGDILNDFLEQSHASDGSLKDGVVTNAKVSATAAIAKTKLASDVQTSLDAADNAIPASQKGASGGVASLTGTTLTPAQIPTTVVTKSTDSNDTGKAIDAHTGAPLVVVSKSDGLGVVVHGGNANTARPAGYAVVHWIGSVEPINAVDDDLWADTSV